MRKRFAKRLTAFLSVLLAALMQFSALPAAGADTGGSSVFGPDFPFITGVTIKDTDNGQVLGGDDAVNIPKDANIAVQFNFSIPNGKTVPVGTTYTIQLPHELHLYNGTTATLTDGSGDTVATVTFDSNGTGTIEFTPFAASHSNVGGTFTITGCFAVGDDENTTPVPIVIQLEGNTTPTVINVNFNQPNATSDKSGQYDAATGCITWTVRLNTNRTTVKSGEFTDVLTPGAGSPDRSSSYVDGSFKVTAEDGTVLYDGKNATAGDFSYAPADTSDTSKTGTLHYTFPDTFEDVRTVTFQTRVADPSQYFGGTVPNTAVFSHDGLTQNISGTASVPVPNYIQKSGSYVVNETSKQINWTVTLNGDNLSLHDVVVTDALPGGLTLDKSSVKFNSTPVSEGTDTGTFSYDDATRTLTYRAGDLSDTRTLTFSTNLPDGYWQHNQSSNSFKNTAKLTASGNSYLESGAEVTSKGVGPGNSVVSKSGAGYDPNTHRITWKIVVNGSGDDLPNAVLTDTIPAGQRYLPDTFTITPTDKPNGTDGLAFSGTLPADPSTSNTTLTYTFGHITGTTYTIQYQTELTDSSVWAGNSNKTYSDSVTLEPGGGWPSSFVTATQRANPTVLTKSGLGYDYTTHELSWQIDVNPSRIPLTNVVVTDVLSGNGLDDFVLEPDSIRVNGGDPGSAVTYDAATKTLTYSPGDLNDPTPSLREKVLTFKLKLNKSGADYDTYFGANGDHNISNTAKLTSTENSAPVQSTASQTIKNQLVGKQGYYSSGNAYIDWSVEINQNGIELDNLSLLDELPEGLSLDTSSVRLYAQTVGADGSLSPAPAYSGGTLSVPGGTALTLTSQNVSYDMTTRRFLFTMPDQITGPYLLTFRTLVDADSSGKTFTNTVSFEGYISSQQGQSGGEHVGFSSSSGSAWGETGSATITKADRATLAPVSGATFGLYDQYGNQLRISDPTGTNGQTVFDKLQFDVPYSIKEQTRPKNYLITSESISFELDHSGKYQLLDENGQPTGELIDSLPAVLDDRETGSIALHKQDASGIALKDAVFTLYDAQTHQPVMNGSLPLTAVSDDEGNAVFHDIPYGSYQVVETTAPTEDYDLSAQVLSAELTDDNPNVINNMLTLTTPVVDSLKTAQIHLTKLGADGGPLEGAGFTLYESDGLTPVQLDGKTVTAVSDEQGSLALDGIPYGDYVLKETDPPANYTAVSQISISLHFDSPALSDGVYELGNVTDVKKTGSIALHKQDASGIALKDAVFTLYDAQTHQPVMNGSLPLTAVSDDEGNAVFHDIPYGSYQVVETTAPTEDYDLSAQVLSAELTDDNPNVINNMLTLTTPVVDSLKTAQIHLTKLGADGGPLEGAGFTLYESDGLTPVQLDGKTVTAVSDEQGSLTLEGIPYGDYVLKETDPPADYAAVSQISISLHYDSPALSDGVYELGNVTDAKLTGSISLQKLDEHGNPLAGAVFVLKDAAGNQIGEPQTSDAQGNVVFQNVPYGDGYTIEETQAPDDYNILSAPIPNISLHTTSVALEAVSDSRKTGSISLEKVDEDGAALAGATFELRNASGTVGQPQTTDAEGSLQFDDVPFGDGYTLHETQAPDGYALCKDIPVNLHTAAYAVGKVTDTLLRGTVRVQKVDPAGAPLSGATFTLYDADGNSIGKAKSGSDGLAEFDPVPYGSYTVKETAAPAGYTKDPAAHAVTLNGETSDLVTITDQPIPTSKPSSGKPSHNPFTGGSALPTAVAAAALLAAGLGLLVFGRRRRTRFGR